jgi:hypothetical protein
MSRAFLLSHYHAGVVQETAIPFQVPHILLLQLRHNGWGEAPGEIVHAQGLLGGIGLFPGSVLDVDIYLLKF